MISSSTLALIFCFFHYMCSEIQSTQPIKKEILQEKGRLRCLDSSAHSFLLLLLSSFLQGGLGLGLGMICCGSCAMSSHWPHLKHPAQTRWEGGPCSSVLAAPLPSSPLTSRITCSFWRWEENKVWRELVFWGEDVNQEMNLLRQRWGEELEGEDLKVMGRMDCQGGLL